MLEGGGAGGICPQAWGAGKGRGGDGGRRRHRRRFAVGLAAVSYGSRGDRAGGRAGRVSPHHQPFPPRGIIRPPDGFRPAASHTGALRWAIKQARGRGRRPV